MNDMLTHIEVVIDRSGSMASIAPDVIGGFNTFIDTQKKGPDQATLTFTQFDTEFETLYDGLPLPLVPKLDDETFVPRGGTALLDAVGQRITACGRRLAAIPEGERPGKVLFLIITDGEENSSREYSLAQVRKMIEHQEQVFSWTFVFIGANQDAFAEAARLGVGAGAALNFVADSGGVRRMFDAVGDAVREFVCEAPASSSSRHFFRIPLEGQDDAGAEVVFEDETEG